MSEKTYQNILAIDCSTSVMKLALSFEGDRLVKKESEAGQSHGQIIYRQIEQLFSLSTIAVKDLDGIIVNTGPGSFTGLRIGIAAAKAIAVVNEIPVVALNLFEIASRKLSESGLTAKVLVPFKKDSFFACQCPVEHFSTDLVDKLTLEDFSQDGFNGKEIGFFVESGSLLSEYDIVEQGIGISYSGSDLIQYGRELLEGSEFSFLPSLEPLYILKSQAEINFERKHNQ